MVSLSANISVLFPKKISTSRQKAVHLAPQSQEESHEQVQDLQRNSGLVWPLKTWVKDIATVDPMNPCNISNTKRNEKGGTLMSPEKDPASFPFSGDVLSECTFISFISNLFLSCYLTILPHPPKIGVFPPGGMGEVSGLPSSAIEAHWLSEFSDIS